MWWLGYHILYAQEWVVDGCPASPAQVPCCIKRYNLDNQSHCTNVKIILQCSCVATELITSLFAHCDHVVHIRPTWVIWIHPSSRPTYLRSALLQSEHTTASPLLISDWDYQIKTTSARWSAHNHACLTEFDSIRLRAVHFDNHANYNVM